MLGRVTLITIVTSGGVFYYITQRERHPGPQLPHDPSKKNVVIVGSGWASTAFLKNLDTFDYNVTVISPRNFFLFTPLLPSVAVGTLASGSILQRKLLPLISSSNIRLTINPSHSLPNTSQG
jgi:NADH:ubiquinone reductase (non-electrogenic)